MTENYHKRIQKKWDKRASQNPANWSKKVLVAHSKLIKSIDRVLIVKKQILTTRGEGEDFE